ncbi:MAG: EAL domain-containing protein [Rhodocyclaceae bacterium]|nr:EAL domain-containing protein [Rhodocyclaceae bacterium]
MTSASTRGGEATAEETLTQLLEWQRAILEGTNHSIIATDPDGLIVSFNKGAEQMLGYRADEVVGRSTPAIIHDAGEVAARAAALSAELGEPVAPGFAAFVAKARRGTVDEREWTYLRKDGARVPVLLSVTALRDGDGGIRGYLGIAIDIGARKRLEEATAQAKANELARALIRAIAEGVIGFEERAPYRVRFLNPHAERLLGLSEAAASGRLLADLVELLPEAGACCCSVADWPACPHGGVFEANVRTRARPEGFPAALAFAPIVDGGDGLAVLTLQDIGARRQAEEKLRLSDKVFEFSAEAIIITDAEARILAVNPAFTFLTGYRPDEVLGQNPRVLQSGRHDAAFYAGMWRALIDDGHWEGELWDRRKDGSQYPKWLSINAVRADGRTTHYVALFADISERKENENRIRFLAEHDHLTGLPNRRLLEARARQMIASNRRRDAGLALMVIDLDRFKNVNDTLGHLAGDELLIEVAKRLVASVRGSDTVVRLGGDEFVVLLEDMHVAADVAAVAAKIRAALNQPIMIADKAVHAPPSIGIALYPEDGEDIETLLRNADTALYRVKATGRNAWLFYTGAMNKAVRERLQLEDDIRHSLAAAGFRLHFQPQFEVGSERIVAWEALLRWPHPERGWVAPEEFIPLAEETGLMLPLGEWVLRTACREVRRWEDQGLGRFRVGVNLSACQFAAPDLADKVAAALAEAGLDAARLELEITERMLMGPGSAATLQRLKALGVMLTLDDFGSGYSSLAYLKSFAVDRLKIDRAFVGDVTHDANDAAIVRAVISLAQALDMKVVAEGVETAAQTDFLVAHGCGETQGFLRGGPMPAEAVAAFLAARAAQ